MEKRLKNKVDIFVGLFTYVLAALVFWQSSSFNSSISAAMSPAVMPRIISSLLCLAGTALIVQSVRNKLQVKIEFKNVKILLLVICALLLYIILMPFLGFIVSSILFLSALIFLFKMNKKWLYILICSCITILIYLLFHNVLLVALPSNVLGF